MQEHKPKLHALPMDTRHWIAASILYAKGVLGNDDEITWKAAKESHEAFFVWGFFVNDVLLFRMYPNDRLQTEKLLEKLEREGYSIV